MRQVHNVRRLVSDLACLGWPLSHGEVVALDCGVVHPIDDDTEPVGTGPAVVVKRHTCRELAIPSRVGVVAPRVSADRECDVHMLAATCPNGVVAHDGAREVSREEVSGDDPAVGRAFTIHYE